jgi:hypothetical protein
MFVSYVLRLRPDSLGHGRFAGEVEAVATGQRYSVRSLEQVMEFVLDTMDDEVALGQRARSEQEGAA